MSAMTAASLGLIVLGGVLTISELWNGVNFTAVAILALTLAGLVLVRRFFSRHTLGNKSMQYIEAQYGIPHCKFVRTNEGFIVKFKSMGILGDFISFTYIFLAVSMFVLPIVVYIYTNELIGELGGIFAAILTCAATFSLLLAVWYVALRTTTVEVTHDAVIINRARLRRRDFGHFFISSTRKANKHGRKEALLGYSYGVRQFACGGFMPEAWAMEMVPGLNRELRNSPVAGNTQQISTGKLRTDRSTKF